MQVFNTQEGKINFQDSKYDLYKEQIKEIELNDEKYRKLKMIKLKPFFVKNNLNSSCYYSSFNRNRNFLSSVTK